MFTDKTRPQNGKQLSTVSTVHGFYDAPGVKTVCTVDTVDSSKQLIARKTQIDGYVLCMETATGTWYDSGFLGRDTRLGWVRDINRCKFMRNEGLSDKEAAKKHADIVDLFGAEAIIGKITARPISIVNHRNILIEEEEQ